MFEKPSSDYILSSAPFFQYVVLMFQDLLITAGIIMPGQFRSVSILIASLPMILALLIIVRTRPRTLLVSFAIAFYIVVYTFAFFPQNEEYLLKEMFYLLCINIPSFLCILAIEDFSVLKKTMLYVSAPVALLGVLYFILMLTGTITLEHYDMAFGYYLLIPALVFLSQNKRVYLVLFAATCVLILLIGSRGALLAALMYFLVLLLLDRKGRTGIAFFALIVVLLAGILFSLNPDLINSSGISYRTLDMIREGGITDDSDRLNLYSVIWVNIIDGPLLGHGIYGDRLILDGYYCHNIFLEILYNYGIYLGSILILVIFGLFINAFLRLNTDGRKLLMMFFCYSFIPLLYSKSYLNDPGFGLFIGVIVALPPVYKSVNYKGIKTRMVSR